MVVCIPFSFMCIGASVTVALAVIVGMAHSGFSQKLDDPPVKFSKNIDLVVSNTADIHRADEPVIIPVESIRGKAANFNTNFFRVKHKAGGFEPLDIPSQIRKIPGAAGGGEELVFQLDLKPDERKTIELQYNPEGTDLPDYPARTRSFGTWYRDGSNSAWENEIIGYRYYYGMVDYFGKSYPGLCLDRLESDSYHHERLWGQDPYAVGKTPGLGGIALIEGGNLTKCYGYPGDVPYIYKYAAHGGGPVCAGVTLQVEDKSTGETLVEAATTLFNGRIENMVRATASPERLKGDVCIAPGMKKFDGEHVIVDDIGFMLAWGIPVEEYGTIGTAVVWDQNSCRGIHETDDARFVKLKPGSDGMVSYLTLAVWYRASSDQPENQDSFIKHVNDVSLGFRNPLKYEV